MDERRHACWLLWGPLLLMMLTGGCGYLASRNLAPGPVVVEEGVQFRFWAPTARRVQLAGDWPENNWARGDGASGEAEVGLMEDADGDGVWEIVVELPPGRHHYLFWVDETTWHTDPGNPEEAERGPARICSLLLLDDHRGRIRIR